MLFINYIRPFLLMAALTPAFYAHALAADSGGAADPPDFTQGDTIPAQATHDWNLGPTGARGWMHSHKLETTQARQIAITQVDAGSPADGVLEVGDVILGIDRQAFSYDPRTELGKAISRAEAADGQLSLIRWRNDKAEIVEGQSQVSSWRHRFAQPKSGRLAGYGMMNSPGLPLTISLILARQAGVENPALDRAIQSRERLLRFYVGKGSVPYGDHHPWIQTHDDNGKNGMAAVMFQLLDDAQATGYFSRMSVASHGGERDTGHTGNWMDEFGWYYDLARRWDGSFLHQGPPAERPDKYHRWDCTGAYLLAYAVPLQKLLNDSSLDSRYGACQAIALQQANTASAVPALLETLQADNLWLRIKAAEALAAIGEPAMVAVPQLLQMLAQRNPDSDPRGMQQRYLCFALFNARDGMLGRSLDGIDRDLLYQAVRAGLTNEDGRARGSVESIYKNLRYEEIEPLLPAIVEAVAEPAPSGVMFADGIRLSGLEVLAEHRISEGLPMCIELIDPDRWGAKNRIKRCLEVLRLYGGAAKSEVPKLQTLEKKLVANNWKADEIRSLQIAEIIQAIEQDPNPPTLRSVLK